MSFEFFIRPSETLMDKVADPAGLVARNPAMADRFDAIKELRGIDDGSVYRGGEFRRVANLVGPIEDLLRAIDPGFLREKRKFYAWLDQHPEYCTYDRRRTRDPNMMLNGVVVTKKIGDLAMGVNIKQAKYSGPEGFGITGDPPVPSSGKPQPLLDTSNNDGVGPGVNFVQATYSGIPGDPDMAPDVPSGGTFPTDSTDVENPEARAGDATPKDILKGGTGNG